MIDKINNNQIPGLRDDHSAKQPNQPKPVPSTPDASLETQYAALIEKATKLPPDDADAVQRARQLLLSGKLESPDNIREAAVNIIKFGP